MKIICITGKSGSGKTYLSSMLASKLICYVIDIDRIAHEALLIPKVRQEVLKVFGNEVFDGKFINRKKLGSIVFNDATKLKFLENLTQKQMEETIDTKLARVDTKYVILEYSLLPKMKYFEKSNFNILVEASDSVRKNRIIKRDNISNEYFESREANALDYSGYKFDLIVNNTKNFDIDQIISKIKSKK